MLPRSRSTLHLQLGQETIYLIMAIAVFAAVVFAAMLADRRRTADVPIIQMREADGFFFPNGSAALSEDFRRKLAAQIIPDVAETGRAYDARIVEVVGHTDQVPFDSRARRAANLDETLAPLLAGEQAMAAKAADNVGLGMARAVAVAAILRASDRLRGYEVIPLSAGPFQRPDDTASTGDQVVSQRERRRIVIRLRRPSPVKKG